MQLDETLHRKVARYARDNSRLRVMLNRYERACGLASGPDPNRAEYWDRQAEYLEMQLRQTLNALAMQQPSSAPRKKRRHPPGRWVNERHQR